MSSPVCEPFLDAEGDQLMPGDLVKWSDVAWPETGINCKTMVGRVARYEPDKYEQIIMLIYWECTGSEGLWLRDQTNKLLKIDSEEYALHVVAGL